MRPDGTYTNRCGDSAMEVDLDAVRVNKAVTPQQPRPSPRQQGSGYLPTGPAPRSPGGVNVIGVVPVENPRTYWRDHRYEVEKETAEDRARTQRAADRIASCKQAAGIRHENRCAGDPDALWQDFEERTRRRYDRLREECRRVGNCEPGMVRR